VSTSLYFPSLLFSQEARLRVLRRQLRDSGIAEAINWRLERALVATPTTEGARGMTLEQISSVNVARY
jgi:hypothetical protein